MSVGNLPPVNINHQMTVVPTVNPASDEKKVVSQETRLPVVGRKDETAKSENDQEKQNMTSQEVEKLTQNMNQIMGLIDKRLLFKVTEGSGLANIQVRVIDEKTGKVLAVIPPKKLQDLLGNFQDSIGILFDEGI